MDFAKTFFAKHVILNILTRYCVFTTDHLLLVMRPYQIVATERILKKLKSAPIIKNLALWRRAVTFGTPPDRAKL